MMFQPTPADVRRFFCTAYVRQREQAPMQPLQAMAALWAAEHPEYHAELADVEAAIARDYDPTSLHANPFLHLAMHLSISEQCSVDLPRGIRQAVELLAARLGSLHAAHHEVMEHLAAMVWQAQRSGRPLDADSYLAAVQRRATRD